MLDKLTVTDYFAILFLVLIAGEMALSRLKLINARYSGLDTFAAFATTAGNVLTEIATTALVIAGLTVAYKFRIFTISPTWWWAWAALFFLDDLAYYWFHRVSHESRFWWASHSIHHSSEHYNFSTAIRQAWTGEITGTWLAWAPLALLGFPPVMILTQKTFALFYQFWIHTEMIRRMPRWFEYLFNTPSHHRVHHGSNPRYLDRNYAGTLMVWDRLFGTFVAEVDEEPVRYGLVHNINTYNPFKIEFHEWWGIGRDLMAARSVREAFGVVFGPPGWRQGETSDHIRKAWAAEQAGTAPLGATAVAG